MAWAEEDCLGGMDLWDGRFYAWFGVGVCAALDGNVGLRVSDGRVGRYEFAIGVDSSFGWAYVAWDLGSWVSMVLVVWELGWYWLGGAVWIHGMGLGFPVAWEDLTGSSGVEAFVAKAVASVGVGSPLFLAWECAGA